MRTKFLLGLATVAALTAIVVPTSTATTEPAVQITINVTLTDTTITMSRLTARRGWGGHFVIRNIGKKPHIVDIGGLRTGTIRPGGKAVIKASFETRGRYPFRVILNSAGAKHTGFFRVV
jgi:cupredoxin-like protein